MKIRSSQPWFSGGAAIATALLAITAHLVGPGPALAQSEGTLGVQTREKIQDPELEAKINRVKKQLATDGDNYRLHYQLGNHYYDAGMLPQAKSSYEAAIANNPKYIEALVNLGSVFSDEGNHEDAITHFEKALALNPDDCKARSNLGNSYYSLSRFPDAIYEYRRAIEIDAKCYSALYNMGVAFADVGMFREAVNWWQKVVKVAPSTDAGKSAQENIRLLERFTSAPIPSAPR